jgi:hypothetical protein
MYDLNAKIFKLSNEQFDLVFFGITAHVAKLFVFVSGNNFVNSSGNAIGNGDLGFVG